MAKDTWSGFKNTSALFVSSSILIEVIFAGLNDRVIKS